MRWISLLHVPKSKPWFGGDGMTVTTVPKARRVRGDPVGDEQKEAAEGTQGPRSLDQDHRSHDR